ncbi:hypothetical protein AB6805_17050 [Chitinophaga sp. RCC_12]|uniref:hypothetical protein n=1 Tax=Chitinophaga sp. RCC_12 TaxID=3239226 RepID=UPI003525E4F1
MKHKFMHLYILIPAFCMHVIMLTACNGDSEKSQSKQPVVSAVRIDSPVHKEADIPTLSTEAYVSGIISRKQAIEKQLPGINAAAAARLYSSLANYMDTALAGITANEQAWLNEYVNYYDEKKGMIMLPAQVQQRIHLLATAGIEPWEIGEGYTDLRAVPAFYTSLFKASLPADYNAFLQLKADEDTVLYSADAGLLIPFSMIGKRVLNWEKFLDAYPNSTFVETAREQYNGYCEDYLFGTDNTPSFENISNLRSLIPENKEEYLSFVQQHGDTRTAGIVQLFLDKVTTVKTYELLRQQVRAAIAQY